MRKFRSHSDMDMEIDIETAKRDDIKKMILADVDPQLKRKRRSERRRAWLFVVVELLLLIALVTALFYLMMGISTVDGNSMYPTLHDGNIVIYQRRVQQFSQGDIVVIKMPGDEDYVKRVVAVAGDTVNIQEGKLYVNGELQETEGALGETARMGEDVEYPVLVKDDQVFVLGDNRENSEDSRMFGCVDIEDIKGRLKLYIGGL